MNVGSMIALVTTMLVTGLAVTRDKSVSTSYGDLKRLSGAEIVRALRDKAIGYAPPGSADAGGGEQFDSSKEWHGTHASIGPITYHGRWMVRNDRLCVTADRIIPAYHSASVCRSVWRDRKTGRLLTDHLFQGPTVGLMFLDLQPAYDVVANRCAILERWSIGNGGISVPKECAARRRKAVSR